MFPETDPVSSARCERHDRWLAAASSSSGKVMRSSGPVSWRNLPAIAGKWVDEWIVRGGDGILGSGVQTSCACPRGACTVRGVDKRALIEQIVASLAGELEGYERSARSAHAEATDEQSKAENKYDTRGLEASYLARGQSRQAAETASALREYQALRAREFGKDEAIDLGAIVTLSRSSRARSVLRGTARRRN